MADIVWLELLVNLAELRFYEFNDSMEKTGFETNLRSIKVR